MATTPLDALAGAWTLVAAYVATDDGTRVDLYGPEPKGSLVIAGGRLTALLTAGGRSGDAAALFGSMLAYTGRVTADAATFVTRVDAAWHPAWEGTEQVRHYTIDGDRLTIDTARGPHPALPGRDVVGTLEWRREG